MLDWSQDALADAAKVAKATIANFEVGMRKPYERTLADLQRALEAAGVIFVQENGDGPGIRLRKFAPGDRVRLKPKSSVLAEFRDHIDDDEIGVVTVVEKDPTARHTNYRVSIQFGRTIVPVSSDHVELVGGGRFGVKI